MERTEVLDMMGTLKLFGMKIAYDETLATAIKRKHEPQRFVGDLLKAEISEKQARSIRYQMTIAKLRLAKGKSGCSHHSVPSLSNVATRPAGGTNSVPPCFVTRAIKSRIADFAALSFHEGSH
jgi:hypothetical protein